MYDTTPRSYYIYCSFAVSTLAPPQEIKWAFLNVLFCSIELKRDESPALKRAEARTFEFDGLID
jgi:hypothetical protein